MAMATEPGGHHDQHKLNHNDKSVQEVLANRLSARIRRVGECLLLLTTSELFSDWNLRLRENIEHTHFGTENRET